jgi:predicted amidohydrolase YtcJ
LIDAHAHFLWGAINRVAVLDVSYPGVASIEAIKAKVAERVGAVAPGTWVVGRGWDEGTLAERRLPTATDLDRAAPANPVWLRQTTGHYGVANSAALRLARIDRSTRDPPGGTIDRLPDGAPTGVLKESAQELGSWWRR